MMHRAKTSKAILLLLLVLTGSFMGGCRATAGRCGPLTATPSHDRDWDPSMAVLPKADFAGNLVHVQNVRNFRYASADLYVPNYDDRVYDLSQLQSVDFIVVPFQSAPDLAHTMVSFGFADGQRVAVSVEARREKDESYSPLNGLFQQYELIYIVADERDVIPLRTRYRGDDVYVYRTRATPDQGRLLFADMMARVNQLHEQPEFYHSLTNNCTTSIHQHLERIAPGRVPWNVAVLLPGRADQYAYQLGLLDTNVSFPETKRRANVTQLANLYGEQSDFSNKIRQY